MATKILLTKNNTKLNIDNSNVYSFDNETIREQFINKEYFNGESYKTLLNQADEKGNIWIDSTSISFSMSTMESGYTTLELLNKNYCVVLEKGKEYFFFIKEASKTNENNVLFTGELDTFTTFDIKDMFDDNEVEIEHAHYKRYNTNLTPIYDLNTPNVLPEEFDSKINEGMLDNILIEDIDVDYTSDILINDKVSLSAKEQIKKVNEALNNQSYLVVYKTNDDKLSKNCRKQLLEPVKFTTSGGLMPGPYYVLIFPLGGANTDFKSDEDSYKGPLDNWNTFTFYDELREDPTILKNGMTITSIPPFKKGDFKFMYDEFEEQGHKFNRITYTDLHKSFTTRIGYMKSSPTNYYKIFCFNLESVNYQSQVVSKDYQLQKSVIPNININSNKKLEDEIKSYISPYHMWKIKSSTGNEMNLPTQYVGNKTNFSLGFAYAPEMWYTNITVNGGLYKFKTSIDYAFRDIGNYTLPTDINAYNEFITRNKTQLSANLVKSTVGAIAGVGLGVATGGVGALIGASSVLSAAGTFTSTLAKLNDLKNTPNKIVGGGNSLIYDFGNFHIKPKLFEYELLPIYKKLLQEKFYKQGVSFGNKLFNINDILKTRYYFNFIQTSKVFTHIKINVSNDIKNNISNALTKGLTIWNVRDLTTFKGLSNYEYNNLEMEIYEKHKK